MVNINCQKMLKCAVHKHVGPGLGWRLDLIKWPVKVQFQMFSLVAVPDTLTPVQHTLLICYSHVSATAVLSPSPKSNFYSILVLLFVEGKEQG